MLFLWVGKRCLSNRLNAKKINDEMTSRQNAIAYEPIATWATITLPAPNSRQPTSSPSVAGVLFCGADDGVVVMSGVDGKWLMENKELLYYTCCYFAMKGIKNNDIIF